MKDQSTRRAVHRFANDELPRFGIVGPFHEAPDLAARVTKAGDGAEMLDIAQDERRSIDLLGLSRVKTTTCGLFPVEAGCRPVNVCFDSAITYPFGQRAR